MIDMSGWGGVKKIPKAAMGRWWDTIDDPTVVPAGAAVLTREQVRALLAEGRECRADIERRIARMRDPGHREVPGSPRCDRCGVSLRGPMRGRAADEPCPGYMAGP